MNILHRKTIVSFFCIPLFLNVNLIGASQMPANICSLNDIKRREQPQARKRMLVTERILKDEKGKALLKEREAIISRLRLIALNNKNQVLAKKKELTRELNFVDCKLTKMEQKYADSVTLIEMYAGNKKKISLERFAKVLDEANKEEEQELAEIDRLLESLDADTDVKDGKSRFFNSPQEIGIGSTAFATSAFSGSSIPPLLLAATAGFFCSHIYHSINL